MLTHINKLTICWSLDNMALYSQEIGLSNVVTIDFCLNPEIFKEEKNISKVNNSEAREQTKRANRTEKKTCSIILVVTISSFISERHQRKCSAPRPPPLPHLPPQTTSSRRSTGLKLLTKTGLSGGSQWGTRRGSFPRFAEAVFVTYLTIIYPHIYLIYDLPLWDSFFSVSDNI